jgi:ankyrin repeat protein
MAAAEEGHTAVVELLVHYRASVNATDSSRTSALMCAATEGHAATIARLLELGADADAVDEDGVTAVAWAEDAGHPDAIQVLMRHLHRHDHHDARDGLCGY